MADLNRRKTIFSIRARLTLQCEIRVDVGQRNQSAPYDRAFGIPDNTIDGTLVNLGQCHACKDTAKTQYEQEGPYHAASRLPQLSDTHFLNPPLSAVHRRTLYY
jgi:hypothetical protein